MSTLPATITLGIGEHQVLLDPRSPLFDQQVLLLNAIVLTWAESVCRGANANGTPTTAAEIGGLP